MSDSFYLNKETLFEDNTEVDENAKKVRIIHFNDVYNIEHRVQEPCGGASRFLETIEYLIKQEPALVFFSGDAFSPSICA